MQSEPLFLARCDEMRKLLNSQSEIDMLDLSRPLRQMLLDSLPLMDAVNVNRIKVSFSVRERSSAFDGVANLAVHHAQMYKLSDTDPRPVRNLKRAQFLKHNVVFSASDAGDHITVHEIIDRAAHVAGAVHFDAQPDAEYRKMETLAKKWRLFNRLRKKDLVRRRGKDRVANSVPAEQMIRR